MSNFLDQLSGDPESGEVLQKPLQVYDSASSTKVAETERILAEKKGTWRGKEPVKITRTDPLSDMHSVEEQRVVEGKNGMFEIPQKERFALRFEFLDPDSLNAGRALFYFKDTPTELDIDPEIASGQKRVRGQIRLLLASFAQLAGKDLTGYSDELDDAEWAKWMELADEVLPGFEDQEVWLQYQVSRWFADRDFGKRFPKDNWYVSERPLRVFEG